MRINNCTEPKPSFGMALRIKFSAVPSLKEMSKGDIDRLAKAGEELKNTKYYDLLIGENGSRSIISKFANSYDARSFEVHKPDNNFLPFDATWEGTEIGKLKKGQRYHDYIMFANNESALRAYNDIRTSYYPIEKYTKIVKYLDESAINKENSIHAENAKKEEVSRMVDNLYNKFGVKA